MDGAKLLTLLPANRAAGRPAIQSVVMLFDHRTGAPEALLDGAELTAIRTAAASGLATSLLAAVQARSHGGLGTGVQAAMHIDAIGAARPGIERVCVWGRDPARAQAFAQFHAARTGWQVQAVADAAEACACDVVSATTGATEPVLRGAWLRASALTEAGDLLIPIAERALARGRIVGEIGALAAGRLPGRTRADQITLYKSLGVVAQDLFAAWLVVERAIAQGHGVSVAF